MKMKSFNEFKQEKLNEQKDDLFLPHEYYSTSVIKYDDKDFFKNCMALRYRQTE